MVTMCLTEFKNFISRFQIPQFYNLCVSYEKPTCIWISVGLKKISRNISTAATTGETIDVANIQNVHFNFWKERSLTFFIHISYVRYIYGRDIWRVDIRMAYSLNDSIRTVRLKLWSLSECKSVQSNTISFSKIFEGHIQRIGHETLSG